MGGAFWEEAPWRILFALLQSAIYLALLHYTPHPNRSWCFRDWRTTDCLSEEGRRAQRSNGTDLQIVLPSYGQTGTTSVITALRELGYRAFHADDYSMYSRSLMWDVYNPGFWSQGVTKCRIEALSLEPTTDMVRLAVETSPKAKFILTWRIFSTWVKSTGGARPKEERWGSIHRVIQKGNRLLPWLETFDHVFGSVRRVRQRGEPFLTSDEPILGYIYRTACNGYAWPQTNHLKRGTFKSQGNEEAYLAHQNEIRTLVPKGRLLEFDVTRHGWADLDRFLGKSSGRAGMPFPNPRTKGTRTNDYVLETQWRRTRWALLAFISMHALNVFVITVALRALFCLLWLVAWALGLADWPLEGAVERWDAAVERSPLIVVLEGADPQSALPLSEALVDAGVRALAVPLAAPGALEVLELLAPALPEGVALGGSWPREAGDVAAVYKARGHFVLGPFAHGHLHRRAHSLGLASLPAACTPTEAAATSSAGSDGCLVPTDLVSPAVARACLDCLPKSSRVAVWGRIEPEVVEEYWAAGLRAFVVGAASLGQPDKSLPEVAARARALLGACKAAGRAAGPQT